MCDCDAGSTALADIVSTYVYLLSKEEEEEWNKCAPKQCRFALNKARSTVMWHTHTHRTQHTIINHILIQFDTKVRVGFFFGIQHRFSR